MKYPSMKSPFVLISPLLVSQMVFAQVPAGSIQQNIEQSIERLPSAVGRFKPLASVDIVESEKEEAIGRLSSVIVKGDFLQQEIQNYWLVSINQPVSAEAIRDFNGWLFAESRRRGYLSYSRTKILRDRGEVLEVTVVQPKLRAVRVASPQPELLVEYGQRVLKRLEQDFRTGQPIDVLGLDQRLDSASYDLPIELDSTLRAVGADVVDMIVNISPVEDSPGKIVQGLAQLNNYGLKSYGRPQLLVSTTWQGHEPKSSLTLVGQKSEGINFGRVDYEAALVGSLHRWRSWAAYSDTHSILGGAAASQGESAELGLGITGIFGGYRDFVFRQSVEALTRQSKSGLRLSGIQTSRIHDQQFRMKTVVGNEKLVQDASRAEYNFTIGNYSRLEGIRSVEPGPYAKMEAGLRHQHSWDEARSYYSVLHLRGQLSSGRLDSYNQMSLGGIGGVRAYTTVDGVGDDGGLLSLEFNKRLTNGKSVGVFYDGGIIKLHNPQSIEYRRSYSLQAVGLQFGGAHENILYSVNLAKGVGGYKGWTGRAYNIESKPNNWRLNVAISYLL